MNKLMTYEQWLELFKRQLRKYIKHKLAQVLYGVSMFMILTVPPLAMIIHWILRGGGYGCVASTVQLMDRKQVYNWTA